MAANSSISLVSLDFDTIKSNLKTYLKNQPQFMDYDFDGSNMSVLLDVLSYNTYLNSFYLNMAVSEAFLDSAQLRNSVVSRAKELNYIPMSNRSSRAIIQMYFQSSIQASIVVIPAQTKFSAENANGSYTFVTDTARTLYPSGNFFTITDLSLYEGSYLTDTFAVDYSADNQRFLLTNPTIDTDSIIVSVTENLSATPTSFILADNLYDVGANSNVFFLQGAEDSKYEVVFGDGVFGRRPLDTSIVQVEYRSTAGSDGNGATNFTMDDNLQLTNNTITVITSAYGGGNSESIASIKYNAPRHYQTQDRAVTANDFKTLVLSQYPDIKNVHVFGGETLSGTVQFGKAFIAPVTYSGYALSDSEKTEVQTYLLSKCTIGINPVMIDPNFLYLLTTVLVKYNAASTISSPETIASTVSEAIKEYNSTYLTDFNTTFKFSRLEAAINDSDASISSNELKVALRKDLNPDLNSPFYPDVSFFNQVIPGSIYSSTFLSGGREYRYTDYNPNNNTFQVTQSDVGAVILTNSVNTIYLKDVTVVGYETYTPAGSIDYSTGTLALGQITITSLLTASKLSFYSRPANQDVNARLNDVILIDDEAGINVTVTAI